MWHPCLLPGLMCPAAVSTVAIDSLCPSSQEEGIIWCLFFAGVPRTPGNGEETLRLHATLLALQVSIDHLRALNATSAELQEGQQHLEPPVQAHRERLLTLLQEGWCHGDCKGALSRASALQLDADFSQVQALNKPTGTWKGWSSLCLWNPLAF